MKIRQDLVKRDDKDLSKRSRAKLLTVNLSSCYVKTKVIADDTVTIMNEIREIYSIRSFQGYRRITWDLKDLGYEINRKKVYRLMKLMGIEAVYPKKNLSKRNHEHKVFPYLLKEYPPLKPHDVWCVDITYIKIATGFIYLTALIDVVSRHVMGWHVSTSLDTESCLRALDMAIATGYKPKVINSDQGCQFTSQEWIYQLTLLEVKISMDGKGRALDNIPIERFWRTVKYEEVYLNTYESVLDAKVSLDAYIHWYNHSRRHSGISHHRPHEVMTGKHAATRWAFMEKVAMVESRETQAYGYVDKSSTYPRDPQGPTTATAHNVLMVKEKKEIKQQQKKVKQAMNLSSKIAA
jgi:putative transposase